jgi:hypothetical protein
MNFVTRSKGGIICQLEALDQPHPVFGLSEAGVTSSTWQKPMHGMRSISEEI